MLRRILTNTSRNLQVTRSISHTSVLFQDKKDQPETTTEEEKKVEEEKEQVLMVEVPASELEELKKKSDTLNDQLLRALAETENVRRIAKRDVMNARDYSIGKFAKSLLDVADNLQRAHQSISIADLKPEDSHDAIKALYEGVVMTDTLLLKTFKEFSIVPHGESGEKFDPNLHDAMFEFEDPTKEAGTIGQVVKSGYRIGERVLRPAQVGTIKSKQ